MKILSFDVGVGSIGSALIDTATKTCLTNVRIFSDSTGDNQDRMKIRSMRKRIAQKKQKKVALLRFLSKLSFVPKNNFHEPHVRHSIFNEIGPKNPIKLRVKGLDHKLEREELVLVFLDFLKRKGQTPPRTYAQTGEIDSEDIISDFSKEMKNHSCRTVGEYFLKAFGGHRKNVRVGRADNINELKTILNFQSQFFPELNKETKRELIKLIFSQNALKSQKSKIGVCTFETKEKRASKQSYVSQYFLTLLEVNNLQYIDQNQSYKSLSSVQKDALLLELEKKSMSFSDIRKLFDFPSSYKFNLEGTKPKIDGNATSQKLCGFFTNWFSKTLHEKEEIVNTIRKYRNPKELCKVAKARYRLGEDEARKFSEVLLPAGYINYSTKAIKNLLPDILKGEHQQSVIARKYPKLKTETNTEKTLPPAKDVFPNVNNSTIIRALSEIRKVTNAYINQHGKPDSIRIENTKFKLSDSKKNKANKNNQKRFFNNRNAQSEIKKHRGNPDNKSLVQKWILFQEQKRQCPYCQNQIAENELIKGFTDVDHIVPFSISHDDSIFNKVICCVKCNQQKTNKTPAQAFKTNAPKWKEIKQRVNKFDWSSDKKKHFVIEGQDLSEYLSEFESRQLNQTGHIAELLKQYFSLIISTDRISTISGNFTSKIRSALNLSGKVNGSPDKNRDKHNHHAIDAVAIALADKNALNLLNSSCSKFVKYFDWKQLVSDFKVSLESSIKTTYWSSFLGDAVSSLKSVNISHARNQRARGPLHEATFYGKKGCEEGQVTIRESLESLTEKDLYRIKDDTAREEILKIYNGAKIVNKNPNKVFSDPNNIPLINGIPIKRVTIFKAEKTFSISPKQKHNELNPVSLNNTRNVATKQNYCLNLYEWIENGVTKREFKPIGMMDIKTQDIPNRKIIMSIFKKDILEISGELWMVVCIAEAKLIFSRVDKIERTEKDKIISKVKSISLSKLLKESFRKVTINSLGEIRKC